jgi:hypothetical protein
MKTGASSHDAPTLPLARGDLSRHVIDVLHDPTRRW